MNCAAGHCDWWVRYPATGLCERHYQRLHRMGDTFAHVPVRPGAFFQPRLPLAPLRARSTSNSLLAAWIGVSRRQVLRWRTGGVPLRAAEDACDALGLHPREVWGDEYAFAASCPLALTVAQVVA